MTQLHMTPRQRMLTALAHEEPDAVPTALGGGPYGIVDALYLRLLEHFDLGEPVPAFRTGHTISFMDDRLLDRLGTDIRYCWPGMLPNSPVIPGEDENSFRDAYGQIWKRALPYYHAGPGLLQEASSMDDIERLVQWPGLSDPRWTAGVEERARSLREQTDYFVTMRMVASHGPFQTACDLRGTEAFLMDMALNPEFAHALLDRITTTLEGLVRGAMQAGGRYFDMIELPGDDYAGSLNTLFSPRMFRNFIKPCLERLVKAVREVNPDIHIMLHSDGAITALLPEFIAIGVDVVHPLEPLGATDMRAVKREYGTRLSFLGGIDISHAMRGTPEDVTAEVKERIELLAAGGGYILAPSNHLQADVPAANVAALFDSAREFGRYSILNEQEPG